MTTGADDSRRGPILIAGIGVASWFVAAAMIAPTDAVGTASVAGSKLLVSAWPAVLYLLAAVGLGTLASPLVKGSADPKLAGASIGLAAMLTWSHVMGQLGLVSGSLGLVAAWLPIVVGLVLFARSWRESPARGPIRPFLMIPTIFAGAALLLTASASPGTLWPSEFGGFDSLSYHLPLPQEWLARGRLEPLTHNVYSFLPSYLEGAFLHLQSLTGASPTASLSAGEAAGMLGGTGWRTLSCQYLHAGLAIWTAWAAGRLARAWIARCFESTSEDTLTVCASVAKTTVLCTPWTLVVGSLSYNEMGVTALGAGVLLIATDSAMRPMLRGLASGLLVGAAIGVKPTAAFMIGGPAAVLLALTTPLRAWPMLALGGLVATATAIAPWTIRNWLACGNPVFPYATEWFGLAHWSPEQLARYTTAHHEPGSIIHKLSLAVLAPEQGQARGFFHKQWLGFFPLAVLGLVLAGINPRTRRLAGHLGLALLAGVVGWLFLTHIQSRFLVPLLPLGAATIAIGAAAACGSRPNNSRICGGVLLTCLSLCTGWFLVSTPVQGLEPWPSEITGIAFRPSLERAQSAERLKFFDQPVPPEWFVNIVLPSNAKLYLLGGSLPFYMQVPVVYHVAWEKSPLGEAMRRSPGNPDAWLADLRAAGITHVLVDFGELARLTASNYSDPLVTPKAVGEFLGPRCQVLRTWGEPNAPRQVLFTLQPGRPGLAIAEDLR